MEMTPECIPCLLGRVLFESELCAPQLAAEAMREGLAALRENYVPGANSAEVATKVHRRVYDALGCEDPYADLKEKSDVVAASLLDRARDFIERSDDRLEAAVLVSIAGNVMDFGIPGHDDPEQLRNDLDGILAQGLDINDVDRLRQMLGPGRTVVYLTDNCGESVLDRLLVEELRSTGTTVVGVVKGAPVLTDVTMAEAPRAGLDRAFDEILTTGMFAVGLDVDRANDRLRSLLDEADIIIAKGMANFESLSDANIGPIIYLMRAKCRPVAQAIGARKGDNVAKLFA
ncbi:hypothetical protein AOA80_05960 [Methanomassiliicoccales archaeon RumEn M1]|jgi:uncharacterized protein with ATP-grasp and redox domains|nr:hypothetical protein AOA80_05960 [Methanomassiliicoccales archaeon RumEn M1]